MTRELDPVRLDAPKSSLLTITDPIPDGIDWWTSGIALVRRPVGRVTTTSCFIGDDHLDIAPFTHPDGVAFVPTPLDLPVTLAKHYSLSPDTSALSKKLADDALKAEHALALSRLLQIGSVGGVSGAVRNPGFATLPAVPAISASGTATSGTTAGTAFTLTRGIAALLEWWRVNGLPGMAIVHVPQLLAPGMAATGQIDPAQQGATMVAGGNAWYSFGPGYEPAIGPRSTASGANKAWIWISGRVYAATRPGAHRSMSSYRENRDLALATDTGIVAFDTGAVAAALVDLP